VIVGDDLELVLLAADFQSACALISSKMSSVACLWECPQGAAGPERGVETPNLITSAARALPGPTATSPATARNAAQVTRTLWFHLPPLLDTMLAQQASRTGL